MFAVDHVLVSDDLLTAQFTCNLQVCKGGCCVQGSAGAPLEPEEREILENLVPRVRHLLTPEALEVIDRDGVWEETAPDAFNTTCVDNGQCVFVTYAGKVALCSLQKVYREGKTDWPKPISCHLYPIRVEHYGEYDVLNYEQIDLCHSGRVYGSLCGTSLADYLEEPLTRKYGAEWYASFREIRQARLEDLGLLPR